MTQTNPRPQGSFQKLRWSEIGASLLWHTPTPQCAQPGGVCPNLCPVPNGNDSFCLGLLDCANGCMGSDRSRSACFRTQAHSHPIRPNEAETALPKCPTTECSRGLPPPKLTAPHPWSARDSARQQFVHTSERLLQFFRVRAEADAEVRAHPEVVARDGQYVLLLLKLLDELGIVEVFVLEANPGNRARCWRAVSAASTSCCISEAWTRPYPAG